MKKQSNIPLIIFALSILIICFNAGRNVYAGDIPVDIQQILKKHKVPQQSFSLYIKELHSAEPWIEFNADVPRNPASGIKIITTLAGLYLLGSDYTWKTHFYLDGTLTDGTLDGDLIIVGGGDPFISREVFSHILFTLRARGLQHIHGDLLINNDNFEVESGDPGDFDNKPYRVYNGFSSATLVNFNAQQFNFIPQGDKLHIYADPMVTTMAINNKVKLIKGPCRGRQYNVKYHIKDNKERVTVTFTGKYPSSCGDHQLLLSVLSNERYIYGVFKSLWENMGGKITGTFGTGTSAQASAVKPFYTARSKPLSEIIVHINKHSNNIMARQLFLTISKESQQDEQNKGEKISARQAIKEWLATIGVPTADLLIDNGSGLSRQSRVSAVTLGKLLEYAYHSSYQPEFMASLPIWGVDGTLKKRDKGMLPAGHVRIKTGSLNNVGALAGYVSGAGKKHYVIVALQNYAGAHGQSGKQVQDDILNWLYQQ